MAVESAADRAALFSAEEFGTPALYSPPNGADPMPCTIVYDLGRESDFEVEVGRNGMRAMIAEQSAMMRRDEVPSVELGGFVMVGLDDPTAFAMGPDTFRIASKPRLDGTGQIWSVDLQKL